MCDPITIATAAVITSTGAAVAQQVAANKAAKMNAAAAEESAAQALEQGRQEEASQRLKVRMAVAEQRAEGGGSGLLVDSGTGLNLTDDTTKFGNLDALTIRKNAQNQAKAYQTQAKISRSSQVSPILTGGSQLLQGIQSYQSSNALQKALQGKGG